MKHSYFYSIVFCITLIFSSQTLSARMPEPPFPELVETSGYQLAKLGEYRYVYRMFFKLYDAALYTTSGARADDVLDAQTNFKLQFRYLREIEKSIILESSAKMLKRNLSASELKQISERVDKLNEKYTTVKAGDRSSLSYDFKNQSTTLSINGEPKLSIPGEDFARLYFTIWLGKQSISESLKLNLLNLD